MMSFRIQIKHGIPLIDMLL